VLYQGKQNATFFNNVLRADDFDINDYTTFDVRAGIEPQDGNWKISVFGRNITNKTYTTSVTTYLDTLFRFTGRPMTYGAAFSLRY
jgi:outer membrane receptor protein involved in Fe transport